MAWNGVIDLVGTNAMCKGLIMTGVIRESGRSTYLVVMVWRETNKGHGHQSSELLEVSLTHLPYLADQITQQMSELEIS